MPNLLGDVFPDPLIRRTVVYVSGPLMTGPLLANVRRACEVGSVLMDRGYLPVVPHFNIVGELLSERPGREWLEADYETIRYCDMLLRIPGDSYGGDREVVWARVLGKPVYYSLDVLLATETPTRASATMRAL